MRQAALKRQDFPHMYIAHHEPESSWIIILSISTHSIIILLLPLLLLLLFYFYYDHYYSEHYDCKHDWCMLLTGRTSSERSTFYHYYYPYSKHTYS